MSIVVPPAVLLLAVFLQRLEAAVLAVPDVPDPRMPNPADPDPDPTGRDPQRTSLTLVPDAGPAGGRPVCAEHRRPARATRVTA
jgi:hypothetical protein